VTLLFALLVGELAAAVGVVFVLAWRDAELPSTVALGTALFSLMLVVMVAVRESR
jgi:hypothetical protein